ncbi:hypothetical protein V8E36_005483 [Tilletia maclaganii]
MADSAAAQEPPSERLMASPPEGEYNFSSSKTLYGRRAANEGHPSACQIRRPTVPYTPAPCKHANERRTIVFSLFCVPVCLALEVWA